MSMVANKYRNVRAGICWMPEIARLARAHNEANIICLPARFIDKDLAFASVMEFLTVPFEGGRHSRRVEKITGDL